MANKYISKVTLPVPGATGGFITYMLKDTKGRSMLAPEFKTNTTYKIGEYVTYNDELWVFIAEHSAGTWDSTHVKSCASFSDEFVKAPRAFTYIGKTTTDITKAPGSTATTITINGSSVDITKYAENGKGVIVLYDQLIDGSTKTREFYWSGSIWDEFGSGAGGAMAWYDYAKYDKTVVGSTFNAIKTVSPTKSAVTVTNTGATVTFNSGTVGITSGTTGKALASASGISKGIYATAQAPVVTPQSKQFVTGWGGKAAVAALTGVTMVKTGISASATQGAVTGTSAKAITSVTGLTSSVLTSVTLTTMGLSGTASAPTINTSSAGAYNSVSSKDLKTVLTSVNLTTTTIGATASAPTINTSSASASFATKNTGNPISSVTATKKYLSAAATVGVTSSSSDAVTGWGGKDQKTVLTGVAANTTKIGATASGAAFTGVTGNALVSVSVGSSAQFVQSYPGSASKLVTTSITPAASNGQITGISSNTSVTASKATAAASKTALASVDLTGTKTFLTSASLTGTKTFLTAAGAQIGATGKEGPTTGHYADRLMYDAKVNYDATDTTFEEGELVFWWGDINNSALQSSGTVGITSSSATVGITSSTVSIGQWSFADVTASKIVNAAAKDVAKVGTTVTVATGALATDGAGGSVLVGLGTATKAYAVTGLTSSSSAFLKSGSISQPNITIISGTQGDVTVATDAHSTGTANVIGAGATFSTSKFLTSASAVSGAVPFALSDSTLPGAVQLVSDISTAASVAYVKSDLALATTKFLTSVTASAPSVTIYNGADLDVTVATGATTGATASVVGSGLSFGSGTFLTGATVSAPVIKLNGQDSVTVATGATAGGSATVLTGITTTNDSFLKSVSVGNPTVKLNGADSVNVGTSLTYAHADVVGVGATFSTASGLTSVSVAAPSVSLATKEFESGDCQVTVGVTTTGMTVMTGPESLTGDKTFLKSVATFVQPTGSIAANTVVTAISTTADTVIKSIGYTGTTATLHKNS